MVQSVSADTRLPGGRPKDSSSIRRTDNIFFSSTKPPDWKWRLPNLTFDLARKEITHILWDIRIHTFLPLVPKII